MTPKNKKFTLNSVLSITTGRLLSDIGDVYQILNHITGDNLFTHAIPRASRFGRPLLLSDHPELAMAEGCIPSLDAHLEKDQDARKAISNWIAETMLAFPQIAESYEISSHSDAWLSIDPIQELSAMVGEENIIIAHE